MPCATWSIERRGGRRRVDDGSSGDRGLFHEWGTGCFWQVALIAVIAGVLTLVNPTGRFAPLAAGIAVYVAATGGLVALMLLRRRPYVAVGLVAVPLVAALVLGGCLLIYGIPVR